jgi:hypothetical protein
VVEYSTDGGATWIDVDPMFGKRNGYAGSINKAFGSPLSGRDAFVGRSFEPASDQAEERLLGARS